MNGHKGCEIDKEMAAGNIFIRPIRLPKGEQIDGHKHNFDHVTIVFSGTVHVQTSDGRDQTFTGPAFFLVKKDVTHQIEAITDAHFWCVYSHRNAQGEVVQEFDGWGAAPETPGMAFPYQTVD